VRLNQEDIMFEASLGYLFRSFLKREKERDRDIDREMEIEEE
jgi:hypothetical protein